MVCKKQKPYRWKSECKIQDWQHHLQEHRFQTSQWQLFRVQYFRYGITFQVQYWRIFTKNGRISSTYKH